MHQSQPITHFLVAKKALEPLPIIQGYDSQLAFGSFSPDLFYLLSAYKEYADTIHASGSFVAFCTMLDVAKKTFFCNEEIAKKQVAFALGFYAHVITDCVFHPYVYRSSLDHWAKHDPIFELRHKKLEASIDQIVQEEIIGGQITTPEPSLCLDSSGLLDQNIAYLFHQALVGAYPDSISVDLSRYGTEDANHPLQAAYRNYCRMPEKLYGIHNILIGIEQIAEGFLPKKVEQHFIEEERQRHCQRSPWPPSDVISSFTYNHIDMFKMAVNGVQALGNAVQSFLLDNGDVSAIDFLRGQNCLYLDQDWNLDTGLPSSENQNGQLMGEDHDRFEYGTIILEQMYSQLQG